MTEFGVEGLVKLSSALLRAATTGSGIDGGPYNDVGLREVEGVGIGETDPWSSMNQIDCETKEK